MVYTATMATESGTDATETPPEGKDRDVLSRLADRGEEALGKLAEIPGGSKALHAVSGLKMRVDELSRKVRGIDELELRIARLEQDVAELRAAPNKKTAASS
jgi:uncharacterized small protein (DUF1192 family)